MRSVTKMLVLWSLASPTLAADPPVAEREGAHIQRPLWSPDGARLSYEANFHDRRAIELYVGDPETGSFSRVQPTTGGPSEITAGFAKPARRSAEVAHDLSWSPEGRFVYTATNQDRDRDLYLDQGTALASSTSTDGGPAWSPDGRWIAFTSGRSGEGDLYLIDTRNTDDDPRRLLHAPGASQVHVQWTPDSAALTYVSHTEQGDNLWLLPSLDADPIRLTDWTNSQLSPRFAPDGTQIAFYANRDNKQRFDLYVMAPTAGASATRIAENVRPNATGPTWSPDGAHIIAVLADDARFNPVVAIPVRRPDDKQVLELGTVGHGDLDLTGAEGQPLRLAYVGQGRTEDEERAYRRLYVTTLPELP